MDRDGASPTSKDRDVRVLASFICVIIAPMFESGPSGLPLQAGFPTLMAQWTLTKSVPGDNGTSGPNPFFALDRAKVMYLKELVHAVLNSAPAVSGSEEDGNPTESDDLAKFKWLPSGPSGEDPSLAGLLATRDVAVFLGLSHDKGKFRPMEGRRATVSFFCLRHWYSRSAQVALQARAKGLLEAFEQVSYSTTLLSA